MKTNLVNTKYMEKLINLGRDRGYVEEDEYVGLHTFMSACNIFNRVMNDWEDGQIYMEKVQTMFDTMRMCMIRTNASEASLVIFDNGTNQFMEALGELAEA